MSGVAKTSVSVSGRIATAKPRSVAKLKIDPRNRAAYAPLTASHAARSMSAGREKK